MGEISCRIAVPEDTELLLSLRLEMLRAVNSLPDGYVFDEAFAEASREYFISGDQMTVLAFDGAEAAGCASLAFIRVMPTFSHPTGMRAHLMNVYTRPACRRKGIARAMLAILTEAARTRGVTEISLDATQMGRPLYEAAGFTASASAMTLDLPLCQET